MDFFEQDVKDSIRPIGYYRLHHHHHEDIQHYVVERQECFPQKLHALRRVRAQVPHEVATFWQKRGEMACSWIRGLVC